MKSVSRHRFGICVHRFVICCPQNFSTDFKSVPRPVSNLVATRFRSNKTQICKVQSEPSRPRSARQQCILLVRPMRRWGQHGRNVRRLQRFLDNVPYHSGGAYPVRCTSVELNPGSLLCIQRSHSAPRSAPDARRAAPSARRVAPSARRAAPGARRAAPAS